MDYLSRAKELFSEMCEQRRHIHQLAELGMETVKTADYIQEQLAQVGIASTRMADNGVTALIGQGKPVVLLRADIDALPVQEQSGLPFAAQNGHCHACGHDLHAAALLTAAKMLKENEADLKGTVKLMFQPGEEVMKGAVKMIEEGILTDPNVDAAMGLHVIGNIPTGMVVCGSGTVASSADIVNIRVIGKGGHGASAHECIDPISILVQIYQGIQSMLTREIDFQQKVSLTFGDFNCGPGATFNIIANEAHLSGTLRTFDEGVRQFILERLQEITEGIAHAFRAEGVFEHVSGLTCLTLDQTVTETMVDGLKKVIPDQVQYTVNLQMNGSEDFAEVSNRVPSAFFAVGAGLTEYPQHNPKIVFNEEALLIGAVVYAQSATEWLRANA